MGFVPSRWLTSAPRSRSGTTSIPSTRAASRASVSGTKTVPYPSSLATTTIGRTPVVCPEPAVQRQLPKEHGAVRHLLHLAGAVKERQRYGKIVRRARLAQVGGGQVHGDAPHREVAPGVAYRRAHPLTRLLDRRIRKAHDSEGRQGPGEISTSTSTMYPSSPTTAQVLAFASIAAPGRNSGYGHATQTQLWQVNAAKSIPLEARACPVLGTG